jgi:hypothetical protein
VSAIRPKFNIKKQKPSYGNATNINNSANYDLLLFDKKVTLAVEGLEPFFDKVLRQRTPKGNALIIAEYINTAKREINISNGYRKITIHTLALLSKFHLNQLAVFPLTPTNLQACILTSLFFSVAAYCLQPKVWTFCVVPCKGCKWSKSEASGYRKLSQKRKDIFSFESFEQRIKIGLSYVLYNPT